MAIDNAECPVRYISVAYDCDYESPKYYFGVLFSMRAADDVLRNDAMNSVGHHHGRCHIIEMTLRFKGVVAARCRSQSPCDEYDIGNNATDSQSHRLLSPVEPPNSKHQTNQYNSCDCALPWPPNPKHPCEL